MNIACHSIANDADVKALDKYIRCRYDTLSTLTNMSVVPFFLSTPTDFFAKTKSKLESVRVPGKQVVCRVLFSQEPQNETINFLLCVGPAQILPQAIVCSSARNFPLLVNWIAHVGRCLAMAEFFDGAAAFAKYAETHFAADEKDFLIKVPKGALCHCAHACTCAPLMLPCFREWKEMLCVARIMSVKLAMDEKQYHVFLESECDSGWTCRVSKTAIAHPSVLHEDMLRAEELISAAAQLLSALFKYLGKQVILHSNNITETHLQALIPLSYIYFGDRLPGKRSIVVAIDPQFRFTKQLEAQIFAYLTKYFNDNPDLRAYGPRIQKTGIDFSDKV